MKEVGKIIEVYDQWRNSSAEMALSSVVKVQESSYRRISARMLVNSTGRFVGVISGGCLEGNALKKAKRAIHKKVVSKVVYDALEEEDHQIGIGLECNGRIEILFSSIDIEDTKNPIELLLKTIEADQPAILLKIISSTDKSLLGVNQLLVKDFENATIAKLKTENLQSAIEITLIRKKPYLGILGPRKRFEKLNDQFNIKLNDQFNNKFINRHQEDTEDGDLKENTYIHSPVGLDIGAESPEEISLSIAAEIVSIFRNRDARPLKFRSGTIHERENV